MVDRVKNAIAQSFSLHLDSGSERKELNLDISDILVLIDSLQVSVDSLTTTTNNHANQLSTHSSDLSSHAASIANLINITNNNSNLISNNTTSIGDNTTTINEVSRDVHFHRITTYFPGFSLLTEGEVKGGIVAKASSPANSSIALIGEVLQVAHFDNLTTVNVEYIRFRYPVTYLFITHNSGNAATYTPIVIDPTTPGWTPPDPLVTGVQAPFSVTGTFYGLRIDWDPVGDPTFNSHMYVHGANY